MPHLTLEYTSNLDEWASDPDLLVTLHRLLETSGGIKIGNCKSRWRMVEEWVVGVGEGDSAFVHLDIRFLEGRPQAVKEAIGVAAVGILNDHFQQDREDLDLQVTVEIQDIRRDAYFKYPSGTLDPPPLTIV